MYITHYIQHNITFSCYIQITGDTDGSQQLGEGKWRGFPRLHEFPFPMTLWHPWNTSMEPIDRHRVCHPQPTEHLQGTTVRAISRPSCPLSLRPHSYFPMEMSPKEMGWLRKPWVLEGVQWD